MRESGTYKNARIWLKTHNLIERRASQLNMSQCEFFNKVLMEYFEKDFVAPALPQEIKKKEIVTSNITAQSPIKVQVTIDYQLHLDFREVAEKKGFYTKQGKPRDRTAIKYLRDEIVVAALRRWVEENK